MKPGRDAVQHASYRGSVRLAERGKSPFVSEPIHATKVLHFSQICKKTTKKCEFIWSIRKKAVPLHAFLSKKHHSKPLAIALGV
jgi:hypothetical protein